MPASRLPFVDLLFIFRAIPANRTLANDQLCRNRKASSPSMNVLLRMIERIETHRRHSLPGNTNRRKLRLHYIGE